MRRIIYAGDSTVTFNKINSYPQAGLSQGLAYYTAEDVFIYSFAVNGRSTKSFIDEGRFEKIKKELIAGDILLIQFGHNDEKIQDPNRYAAPYTDYKNNLKMMAQTALDKGAFPVIISPVARRLFDADGVFMPGSHGEYPKASKEAAKEMNIPFIDLTAASEKYLSDIGDTASRPMYVYPKDNSHFQLQGAVVMAGFIARAFEKFGGIYSDILIKNEDTGKKDVGKMTSDAFKNEGV